MPYGWQEGIIMELCELPEKPEYIAANSRGHDESNHPQVRLWVYRLLFRTDGYKSLVRERDFSDDELARQLGFADVVDGKAQAAEFDRTKVIAKMRADWQEVERNYAIAPVQTEQFKAVRRLGCRLGLNDVECEIVGFRLAAEMKYLRDLFPPTDLFNLDKIVEVLAACLGRDINDIRNALSPTGTLIESGLIEIETGKGWPFLEALDVLSCIKEEVHFEHPDSLAYFRDRLIRAGSARLAASDFPHVARDIEIMARYLVSSVSARRRGVNILIHGKPGTGKSEFVRMIAAQLGMNLVEVAVSDRGGRVLDADDRFRAFRLGQSLLGKASGQLMLFDEIEDVFQESDLGPRTDSNRSQRKGWVNRLMEDNPVPSFWITNNTWVIDRAFLRRFDYVLALDVPPRSVRSRVLDNYLADFPVSEDWKRKMAGHEGLVPAIVERAAKVVHPLKDAVSQPELERSLSRVLGNTLEVMDLPREPKNWANGGTYRLDVLNADCEMEQVKDGLMAHHEGRICLYGPPGTGKTAFGHYLAEVLDRPLLVKRASDIVSPWLGMTEKNMARMFRQAHEEDAVLLLDEADCFLQDRRSAQHSWEVTEVSEMLTQMEGFAGIFIASTNLMTSLDPAALRRFDLKIRFDYLRSEQAWTLFEDTRARLGITDDLDMASSLSRLDCLVPGDFANVARQARLRPIKSSMALLQRLRAECEMKPEGKRRAIGFTA
jgi:SpoVK/Ycf46/Vps4 family AAA+-type ATPase